jgi:hypothetical protein
MGFAFATLDIRAAPHGGRYIVDDTPLKATLPQPLMYVPHSCPPDHNAQADRRRIDRQNYGLPTIGRQAACQYAQAELAAVGRRLRPAGE